MRNVTLKIGIDVTPLPPKPVGAGNYIIQLVRAISALQSDHQIVLFAQPAGRRLIGELPYQNLEWVMTPDLSPALRLIWEQICLPAKVREQGVELLHSLHYTRPYFLPCASVVTFHDMTFFLFPELHTRFKRLFFPAAIRLSSNRADALIAVSESTRQDALRILHISPDKIFSVPNGIRPEFRPIPYPGLLQECRKKYSLPEDFLLFVGLIEPRKNLPMLLRSYAQMIKSQVDFPLVLVGRQGWRYEEVCRLVRTLGLEKRVHFTGYIPDQDLPLIYNLARIFVYPSNYEGFGFPPLEAMACGIPVITTSISAMLDTVGDAGVLIPPQDEQALTAALISLLSDQAFQKRLSLAGQARAADFTWERAARETIKVYEKTI